MFSLNPKTIIINIKMNNHFKTISINFLTVLKKNSLIYQFATYLKNIFFYFSWHIQFIKNLIKKNNFKKKILLVYDLNSQPYSIGDFLNLLEASLIISETKNIQHIDCMIIYQMDNLSKSDIVFKNIVNSDNVFDFINNFLPLFQLNHKIRSIFLIESVNFFIKFFNKFSNEYYLWPSYTSIKSGTYLSPVIFNNLLNTFYIKNKSIPYLKSSRALEDWSFVFFNSHSKNRIFVTVNLRANKNWSTERNSNIPEWIKFFNHCNNLFDVTFFIICSKEEVHPSLLDCKNVVLVKNFNTNSSQDLALIQNSHYHMGANSGPSTIAWFSEKPFLTVNMKLKKGNFYKSKDMIIDLGNGFQKLNFFKKDQLIFSKIETASILINVFENIYPKLLSYRLKN